MKIIELHILQSYPVSCLNRDDVGSPKSAVFGGHRRARISSQCLKRAVRLYAKSIAPNFEGVRSRFLHDRFKAALIEAGLDEDASEENAEGLCNEFSKLDSKHPGQVKTAVYLSPKEIEEIATAISANEKPKKAIKKVNRLDAADIALFGRMVANDASLNVEGAAMFSHALSTHKSSNEVDYFAAVDDAKPESEDAGAAMTGTLEYSSATYYRYVALNLGLLFDDKHLGLLNFDERKAVVDAFIRATLMSVPGARKNSMNAHTLPFEVFATYKKQGQPIQLVNAFEKPVKAIPGKGFAESSLEALQEELTKLKDIWGIEHTEELWLSEEGLRLFIGKLTSYVQ